MEILVFGPIFSPCPHMSNIVRMDVTQNHPKNVGTCPDLTLQFISQNQIFQNYRPEPPPQFTGPHGEGGSIEISILNIYISIYNIWIYILSKIIVI